MCEATLEDVIQEVFLRIRAGRCRYSGLGEPGTFLCRTAWNVLREHRARADRPYDTDSADPLEAPSPSDWIEATEQALAIREAIGRLPRVQRQTVEMVYLRGMERSEVARALDCTDHVVHVAVSKACRRLARLVGPDTRREEKP